MTVWILEEGDDAYNMHVVGVFETEAAALAARTPDQWHLYGLESYELQWDTKPTDMMPEQGHLDANGDCKICGR